MKKVRGREPPRDYQGDGMSGKREILGFGVINGRNFCNIPPLIFIRGELLAVDGSPRIECPDADLATDSNERKKKFRASRLFVL